MPEEIANNTQDEESTMPDADQALEGIEPLQITRDSNTLKFAPRVITKKERAGSIYFAPNVEEVDIQAIIDFYSKKQVVSWLQQKVNLLCQAAARMAEDEETGDLNMEKLTEVLSTGNVRGESKTELVEERNKILAEVLPLLNKQLSEAAASGDMQRIIAASAAASKAMDDIAALNKEIDSKSREFKPRKKREKTV